MFSRRWDIVSGLRFVCDQSSFAASCVFGVGVRFGIEVSLTYLATIESPSLLLSQLNRPGAEIW
jgi:hypothetical protein